MQTEYNISGIRLGSLCSIHHVEVNYVHTCMSADWFFFFKQKTAYEISACLVGSEMCIRDRTTRVSNPKSVGYWSIDVATD